MDLLVTIAAVAIAAGQAPSAPGLAPAAAPAASAPILPAPFSSSKFAISTAQEKFNWNAAIAQSFFFLGIQQGYRVAFQSFTREQLKGPYFRDWFRSVTNYQGWDDGDPFIANYIGHPLQGSVTAFIQVQNDPRGRALVIGRNREYWHSRLRALGWATLTSVFYELGPLGDAAIGNVGMPPKQKKGLVDQVITPTLGVSWMLGEDLLDRYVIAKLEGNNRVVKILLRSWLNPSRTLANFLRMRDPWHRDSRPWRVDQMIAPGIR